MSAKEFFKEQSEQSRIKTEIVTKYFWSWAKIMLERARADRIAYIDLFAGPGFYEDGTASTPVLLLDKIIEDEEMCQKVVPLFNDDDPKHATCLSSEIKKINNIGKLKHQPKVYCEEINLEAASRIKEIKLIPTFLFLDPYGYKGITLGLIEAVLKNWGCECMFFFNYNRINMDITNYIVEKHIDAIFGKDRSKKLRSDIQQMSPIDRERNIVNELILSLQDSCGNFVMPFCFKSRKGKRTSHLLVFVSKNQKGYEIMKEIMAPYSTRHVQEVPSYTYDPSETFTIPMFDMKHPLDELEEKLLISFAGKTLTMIEIYRQHNVETPYIKKNYKKALIQLDEKGEIITSKPENKRRKGTFADDILVTFPQKLE